MEADRAHVVELLPSKHYTLNSNPNTPTAVIRAGGKAQAVQCLPKKLKGLGLIPSTAKINK
jgi:hypothetical protein